jgi:hypothetical protein
LTLDGTPTCAYLHEAAFFARQPETFHAATDPPAPAGLVSDPACLCQASRQVTLAWNPNTEATLKGYQVFCRQGRDVYRYNQPVWDGTAVSCTLPGLGEYTDYAFVVRTGPGR